MIRKQAVKPVPQLFGLRPARKPPKFMDQLQRRIAKALNKKTPAKHVAAAANRITSAYRTELAGIFATVLLAKKTFDATRQVDIPFPDKYFDGTAPVDAAARSELMAYGAALEVFQEQCEDAGTPLGYSTAQGVSVWVASVYGLAIPELTPEIQRMWTHLVNGEQGVEDAFQLVIRRAPSDIDQEYFKYRPKVFTG